VGGELGCLPNLALVALGVAEQGIDTAGGTIEAQSDSKPASDAEPLAQRTRPDIHARDGGFGMDPQVGVVHAVAVEGGLVHAAGEMHGGVQPKGGMALAQHEPVTAGGLCARVP